MKRSKDARAGKGLWWDEAWSLVSGCTPVSRGCDFCWAAKQSDTRGVQQNEKIQHRYGGLTYRDRYHVPHFNGEVRFMDQDLLKPFDYTSGRVFSVWTDLWHADVSDEQIALAFATMMACTKHDFVICTKRPDRATMFFDKHSPADCWAYAFKEHGTKLLRHAGRFTADQVPDAWPLENVIGMVTVELQSHVMERIAHLVTTPFAVRAIALEPLLGPVDFSYFGNAIDWVTAGCEAGKAMERRKADPDWFRQIVRQCDAFDIPLFLKQMDIAGRIAKVPEIDGEFYDQFPE